MRDLAGKIRQVLFVFTPKILAGYLGCSFYKTLTDYLITLSIALLYRYSSTLKQIPTRQQVLQEASL